MEGVWEGRDGMGGENKAQKIEILLKTTNGTCFVCHSRD